jgi:hypothetical protein
MVNAAEEAVRRACGELGRDGFTFSNDEEIIVEGGAIGTIMIGPELTVLSGRGPSAAWLASIANALALKADGEAEDAQRGEPIKDPMPLSEIAGEVVALRALEAEPVLPTPAVRSNAEEGAALLSLLIERKMIEAELSDELTKAVGTAIRKKVGSAALIELLFDHDDVAEIFADEAELGDVFEAW